ncbi:MAG: nucleotidyltransferase domain-containing protein [Zestosphaera sp.]
MFRKGLECLSDPYKVVMGRLLEELLRSFGDGLISVVVFGSVARGTARRDSDVDALIVAEKLPKSRLERLALYLKAEERVDPLLDELLTEGYAVSITPILKTREEAGRVSPLYLDMTEEAVIVYDKDSFFESVLLRLREELSRLGSRRVWLGRKWYWVLKEDFKFGEAIVIE